MKKIFSMMLLAGVISLTSCNSDESVYGPENLVGQPDAEVLTIASSDAFFESAGGTANIVVNTTDALEATTDADWLTLAVEGNVVKVTAGINTKLEGRNTQITIKTANASTHANVSQKGVVYGLSGGLNYTLNDDEQTLSLEMEHSLPVEVTSQVDWIVATFNEETSTIDLEIEENATGWRRSGQVNIKSGEFEDVVTITQFDFDTDVLGEFDFYYYNTSTQQWNYLPAMLTEDNLYIQRSTSTIFTIPVSINKNEMTIKVGPTGTMVGQWGTTNYYAYLLMGFSYNGSTYHTGYTASYSKTTYSTATLTEAAYQDGTEVLLAEFGGQVLDTYDIIAWFFYLFENQDFSATGLYASGGNFFYPQMEKVTYDPSETGDASRADVARARRHNAKLASDYKSPYVMEPATIKPFWK